MITKILFTLLVIIAALVFVRHKNSRQRQGGGPDREQQAADRRRAMVIAIALVLLTLLVSAGIYYSHWQNEHRLFSVLVTHGNSGEVQRYTVYRREINGRSFRTVDGRLIHLADSERMEIREEPEGGTE
jgi:ABC-type Fe3+ transport system permease subunit